ncbi:ATP-binding response regulator [Novilysobacter erysipheiresistens]|uniref:histidine kinase n=1 Tax=Novilysobacter erysipheiresistens TaxID=1749332 RepID=A0ABU7YWU7_9GAMM
MTTPDQEALPQRLLLLLPTARDAGLTRDMLARHDIVGHVCADTAELGREIAAGAGAVMLAEESLGPAGVQPMLARALEAQPSWSDLPVLLLTHGGADSTAVGDAVAMLSNVTLLERPLRVAALLSAVRTALRARNRQYEIRAQMRKLEQAHDAEVLALQRKDEFLAMLAHELRNPLAPINNALHVLAIDDSDPARRKHLREMMARQVTHMVRLVDDLLEASRLSRGMITLHSERIDLRAALRGAVELSRPQLQKSRCNVEMDLPDAPLEIDADPVRIAQVFGNLLNNAAKYGNARGHIRIVARTDGDDAVVEVSDDGQGIESGLLPHLFELFTQGERTQGAIREGLGIGLALVRNLVELHGGTVEARSDGKDLGACFTVRLPLAREASAAATDTCDPPRSTARAGSVVTLVVDDNVDAAASLVMVLQSLGLDPYIAHSGAEALELAGLHHPQLVLLDIGMPGMDGYEVARRIRGDPGYGQPVLVAITGWSHPRDLERSHAAGFDHHLAKPADIGRIQRIVEALRDEATARYPEARLQA